MLTKDKQKLIKINTLLRQYPIMIFTKIIIYNSKIFKFIRENIKSMQHTIFTSSYIGEEGGGGWGVGVAIICEILLEHTI